LFIVFGDGSRGNDLMTPRRKEIHRPSIISNPMNIPNSKIIGPLIPYQVNLNFKGKRGAGGETILKMQKEIIMSDSSTLPLSKSTTRHSRSQRTIIHRAPTHRQPPMFIHWGLNPIQRHVSKGINLCGRERGDSPIVCGVSAFMFRGKRD